MQSMGNNAHPITGIFVQNTGDYSNGSAFN